MAGATSVRKLDTLEAVIRFYAAELNPNQIKLLTRELLNYMKQHPELLQKEEE
jgi:hypothetical protein